MKKLGLNIISMFVIILLCNVVNAAKYAVCLSENLVERKGVFVCCYNRFWGGFLWPVLWVQSTITPEKGLHLSDRDLDSQCGIRAAIASDSCSASGGELFGNRYVDLKFEQQLKVIDNSVPQPRKHQNCEVR